MNTEIENEFKMHLKKVCKSSILRHLALEFFYDLDKKFEDLTFSANTFESLNLDGEYFRQDIVNDLFSKKTEATACEVFLYLFKSNVKRLNFFTIGGKSKNNFLSGYFNALDKIMRIRKLYPNIGKLKYSDLKKSIYSNKTRPPEISEREWKELKKKNNYEMRKLIANLKKLKQEAREESFKQILAEYKHVLYHELCHVFELKTFNNRKLIKNTFSNLLICKKFKFLHLQYLLKDTKYIDDTIDNKYYQLINEMEIEGSIAISEILNEELASILDNTYQISPVHTTQEKRSMTKSILSGSCTYNRNYDIASFIHLALPNENILDFRFNSSEPIEKLNNLNISADTMNLYRKKLIKLISEKDPQLQGENAIKAISQLIERSNIFSILCIIVGYTDILYSENDVNLSEVISDCKAIAQGILIEGIKNNLIDQINDESVAKDEEFFICLNDCLKTIDNFSIYPDQYYYAFHRTNDMLTSITRDSEILSIEKYCKKYSNLSHLSSFNELVNLAKDLVKLYSGKIENLDEIMTFLKKQQSLDQAYFERNIHAEINLIFRILQKSIQNPLHNTSLTQDENEIYTQEIASSHPSKAKNQITQNSDETGDTYENR